MPDLVKAKQIVDRFNGSPLNQLEARNEEISRIACTRRESIHVTGQVSTSHTEDLQLDTTARESAQILQNGLTGGLIPASNPWFGARKEDGHTDSNTKALEMAMRRTFDDLSSARSNFYESAVEDILSGIHFGVMCCRITEGNRRKLNFKSIPAGHYIYIIDDEGFSDTILRKWSMTADAMEKFFGLDGLPSKVKKSLASPDKTQRETRYKIIHQIEPNPNPSGSNQEPDPRKRDYSSIYVLEDSSTPEEIGMTRNDGKDVVYEDGLYENPYIVERLFTVAGSDVGEGITSLILPKIREAQNSKDQQNRVKDQVADPSWFNPGAEEYDYNDSGQNFVYDPIDPYSKPERIQSDVNAPAVIEFDLEKIKRSIESSYFVDYFKFFTNQEGSIRRTAFESAEIKAEQLSLAIVPVTRFILFFSRVVETVFAIKQRNGDFKDLEADFPDNYEVEITSPLAKALQGSTKAAFVEAMSLIAQVDPIMPWLKHTHDFQAELVGIWVDSPLRTKNARTTDEAQKFYEKEMQMQQAMQAAQVANQAGDAVSKFNQGGA